MTIHATSPRLRKAELFLRSAAVLLEMEDYDSCTSRAYFAMFFAARAALPERDHRVRPERSVRAAFADVLVDRGPFPERAAEALQHAGELREVADYAADAAVSRADAEWVLREAEALVDSVRRFLSQPTRVGS